MEVVKIMNMVKRMRILTTPKFLFLNKFINSYSEDKIKLLDVGCGNKSPSITVSLFPKIEYFGLDKEEYNLTNEDKKILENKYFLVDLDNLSELDNALPNNYFDFIIMSHVIEHTRKGTEILEILSKKLKVGGGIYIEFPSVRSLSLPSMEGTLNFCDDPTHVKLYDVKEIANTLIKCEFKIIKAGTRRNYVNMILTPLKVIYYLIKYRKINGYAFWDILGFAEFVYAVKIKDTQIRSKSNEQ
jgi:SAM-dependent methyltransferase